MDKLAQSKRQTGRGILNRLREQANRPTGFLEGIFKPELERVMRALNELDDRIRSEITGTKIGKAEQPAIKMSAKDLLKESRKAFNRREYMTGVSDLAMFHKKLQTITNDIDRFFVDVNKIHHKFLFQGVNEEKLKRLREHMEPKAATLIADQLVKEAGLIDEIVNLSRRGRGLAAWERKYPKETKALREGGLKMLEHADSLFEFMLTSLREMATARATRRPDDYMDIGNKLKGSFSKFDTAFKSYYTNAVQPWMRIKDEIDKQEQAQQTTVAPSSSQTGKAELGSEPPPSSPSGGPPTSSTPLPGIPSPGGGFVTVQPSQFAQRPVTPAPAPAPAATAPEVAPDTLKNPPEPEPPVKVRVAPVNQPKVRVAHENFYKSLESMSQEDPRILCSYITKYAKSIQGDDPETAIKLFSIVKKLNS